MTTTNTPNAAERPSAAQIIAAELARIDGYDPEDQHGGLYDLRWSGGPNPEPQGDAWSMDYLPKAERIAAAIDSHHPAESVSADYPECSGDPACCPENEGFGCCKPNPQPSTPGAVSDEDVLVAQLRGRALFLRKLGRVKSPSLMERAADALESFAKRSAAPPAQAVSDEDVQQWGYALERCVESQRLLAKQIDDANPDDAYASMMVYDDISTLETLQAALESFAKRSAGGGA